MNFVQIGANKGYDDFTKYIVSILGVYDIENLILVEPLFVHNSALERCYGSIKNLHIENVVIVDTPQSDIAFFYHINDGPGYEVSSITKEHILKHVNCNPNLTEDGIREQITPCILINDLFSKYEIKDIYLLAIDAEGYDDKIIYSIDFERFNISKIIYENLHINNSKVEEFLINKGYKIEYNVGQNGWSNMAIK